MPKSITISLETVTPLFLGGAEPRGVVTEWKEVKKNGEIFYSAAKIDGGKPELRPSAFRGLFRFWLRVVAGGIIGENNLKDLHKLESSVFGSTDVGSNIIIQLRYDKQPRDSPTIILPHKKEEKEGKGKKAGWRRAINPEQPFDLILRPKFGCSDAVWETALAIVELSLMFGGIGLRSRRGYGTLRIAGPQPMQTPVTASEWETHIQRVTGNVLNSVSKLANALGISTVSSIQTGPSKFPMANQKGLIWIGQQTFPTAMKTLETFMENAHTFIKGAHTTDYDYIGFAHGRKRQASPLWVRVIQVEQNNTMQYAMLMVILASKFERGNENYPILEKLVRSFPGKPVNVNGWNQ
jgi:CRISPR-associated protein Cmr1